jgi:hypothetical protein
MHPPVELHDTAFPDIAVSFDSDKKYDNKVGHHHGAGKTEAQGVSGNVFRYLNLGLRMGRHLQQHVGLTPQLILQLPLQLLLLRMLQKQIWTYASAAVTH